MTRVYDVRNARALLHASPDGEDLAAGGNRRVLENLGETGAFPEKLPKQNLWLGWE